MTRLYNRTCEKPLRRRLRNRPTSAEGYLWQFLRKHQLAGCKFRRQYSVGPYALDFFTAEVRLAIEIDGDVHESEAVRQRDRSRQRYVESFGIEFLRFSNEDVFERLDDVLQRIERKVVEKRHLRGERNPAGDGDIGGGPPGC